MSNGKSNNTRLHLAGGKTAAKKTKTFNYKEQSMNSHSNTAVKNPNNKLKNEMISKNKNFAYGEGMENIVGGINGNGSSYNYQFGAENLNSSQASHPTKNIAPIPFNVDGQSNTEGPHNNNE